MILNQYNNKMNLKMHLILLLIFNVIIINLNNYEILLIFIKY